jgi:bacterioferritin-associated ferredoxin
MYICICKAVPDSRTRRAVEHGVVLTLRDLRREFGVGTGCGKCVPAARELLDQALQAGAAPLAPRTRPERRPERPILASSTICE